MPTDQDSETHRAFYKSKQEEPDISDAMLYLNRVKDEYSDDPHVYDHFLELMRDYKTGKTDAGTIIKGVEALFRGKKYLVEGFGNFLPRHLMKDERSIFDRIPIERLQNIDRIAIERGITLDRMPPDRGISMDRGPYQGLSMSRMGHERIPYDRLAHERIMRERMPKERSIQERGLQERIPHDRMIHERIQERVPIERMMPERGMHERGPNDRLMNDRGNKERISHERLGHDRIPNERAMIERMALDRTMRDRNPYDRPPNDRQVYERNYYPDRRIQYQPRAPAFSTIEDSHKQKKALGFVHKVKNRLADKPDAYKTFIEILQMYQKTPTNPDKILAQLKSLLSGNDDLLEEFVEFVPQVKTKQFIKEPLKDIKEQRETKEILKEHKNEREEEIIKQEQKSEKPQEELVKLHFNAKQEETAIFKTIQEILKKKNILDSFLKLLNMFNQDCLSPKDFIFLLTPILKEKELIIAFKNFINYKEIDYPPHILKNLKSYKKIHSYRILPEKYREIDCEGQDHLAKTVLNTICVSCPTLSSEESTFVSSKKNICEEILYKVEDERYECELNISRVSDLIICLEELSKKLYKEVNSHESNNSEDNSKDYNVKRYKEAANNSKFIKNEKPNNFADSNINDYNKNKSNINKVCDQGIVTNPNDDLDNCNLINGNDMHESNENSAINDDNTQFNLEDITMSGGIVQETLIYIYGEKGFDILEGILTKPGISIPIVSRRLFSVLKKLKKEMRIKGKVWRETISKHYYKALDSQTFLHKMNEKKDLSTKNILKNENVIQIQDYDIFKDIKNMYDIYSNQLHVIDGKEIFDMCIEIIFKKEVCFYGTVPFIAIFRHLINLYEKLFEIKNYLCKINHLENTNNSDKTSVQAHNVTLPEDDNKLLHINQSKDSSANLNDNSSICNKNNINYNENISSNNIDCGNNNSVNKMISKQHSHNNHYNDNHNNDVINNNFSDHVTTSTNTTNANGTNLDITAHKKSLKSIDTINKVSEALDFVCEEEYYKKNKININYKTVIQLIKQCLSGEIDNLTYEDKLRLITNAQGYKLNNIEKIMMKIEKLCIETNTDEISMNFIDLIDKKISKIMAEAMAKDEIIFSIKKDNDTFYFNELNFKGANSYNDYVIKMVRMSEDENIEINKVFLDRKCREDCDDVIIDYNLECYFEPNYKIKYVEGTEDFVIKKNMERKSR